MPTSPSRANSPPRSSTRGRGAPVRGRTLGVTLLAGVAFVVLAGRLVQLQVVQGATHLAQAKAREAARMRSESILPRIRGRILDRNGVILADNRDAYAVALAFDFMTGEWEEQRVRTLERDFAGGRRALMALSARERMQLHDRAAVQAADESEEIKRAVAQGAGVPMDALEASMAETAARINKRGEEYRARLAASGLPAKERLREETEMHAVADGLLAEQTFALNKVSDRFPDVVEVRSAPMRVYPERESRVTLGNDGLPGTLARRAPVRVDLTDVADLVVGTVRDRVQASDLRRRPFDSDPPDWGGYRDVPDLVGARGVERAWDEVLRGAWGLRERTRADDGSVTTAIVRPPVDGSDIRLTIDVELQRRVQAILHPAYGLTVSQQEFHTPNPDAPRGLELDAAVAVVDVETGEILALASQPGPGMVPAMSDDEERRRSPYIDRSVDAAYAPGSILKPFVYLSAVAEGECGTAESIECTGHFFDHRKDLARCWIYRQRFNMATHGALAPQEALARSCNIYFYELADRLGARGLTSWLRQWGLGEPLHAGLEGWRETRDGNFVAVGEAGGSLPSESRMAQWDADGDQFSPVILGIGQGEMTWSPLQAANAVATLARGGIVRDAHIVRDRRAEGARPERSLGLSATAVRTALAGMRDAVQASYGTANHVSTSRGREEIFSLDGISVWGKTGTAQAGLWRIDTDGDGQNDRAIKDADHAWFVCLVGNASDGVPRIAVAVIVERAGSGGRAAGPVAAAVARELSALGYLQPSRPRESRIHLGSDEPEADE